eukprot:10530067-Ditylum_brightwellii.AAC.1
MERSKQNKHDVYNKGNYDVNTAVDDSVEDSDKDSVDDGDDGNDGGDNGDDGAFKNLTHLSQAAD